MSHLWVATRREQDQELAFAKGKFRPKNGQSAILHTLPPVGETTQFKKNLSPASGIACDEWRCLWLGSMCWGQVILNLV